MPTISVEQLREIASQLLQGAGASAEEASIISRHSMAANLAGHDSHGIIAIPGYIDRIKRGHIVPGTPFEIIQEPVSPQLSTVTGDSDTSSRSERCKLR